MAIMQPNIDELTTFSSPQEILKAISDGVEDLAEPLPDLTYYKGPFNPDGLKMGLPKEGGALKEDLIAKMQRENNLRKNITGLTGDYTNKEEVLKKFEKREPLGKRLGTGGLFEKTPNPKNLPALKPEKTKINSEKLDKLDKMLENIDKATNGKITTHKPVSTIMNLPKKDRAEAVKKLGFKVRDDLKKLNETLKNNPGSLNLSPREKLELEMFMSKVNMQGGPDKFVEHNFKLTPDELKLGKTELEQAKEKDEAQKAKVEAERKEQSSHSKTNESQKKEDSKDKKEPTKEEKTLSQDKESQKKEPLLKEAKDEKPKENEKSSKENNSKEDKPKETKTKEFSVKEHKSEPSTKEEKPKEATKAESALKENKETVKTLDLKTTEKTNNDLVVKASDTKDVKPIMSGPTAAPTAPTQNLNVGGRV